MINADDILAKLEAKQAAKIAALTPEERADLERRQAGRAKRILEEIKKADPNLLRIAAALDGAFVIKKLATETPAAFNASLEKILGEYTQEEIDAFLSKCHDTLYTYLDEKDDDLADIATDKARRQGVESAANLPGILDALMSMKAQGNRIEAQTAPSLTRAQIRDISNHFNTVGSSGTRGYVLDFTDKTFDTFATDVVGHTIRRPGMSKWKSLDAYLMDEATPDEARTLLVALLDHEEATSGETNETRRIRALLDASKTGKADAIEAHLAAKLDRLQETADGMKAQGDRIEGKVGDIDGKVNETQNATNLALKTDRAIASKLKTVGPCIASAVERGMEKTTRAVSGARVQLDHLKAAIEKKDDDLEGVRQLQRATLAAVHGLKDNKPAQDETAVPDHRDYQVTTTQLADLLTNLGAGRTARQIQLWEKHLKTDGREGTPPPDGYNLGTRLTIETATAWAQTFASHETDKLKTKIAFDNRFHQRPK